LINSAILFDLITAASIDFCLL